MRIDALRALGRWSDALAALRELPRSSFPTGRAAPRRCSRRRRRWRRPAARRRRRPTRARPPPDVDRRSTGASGPRRRSRPGATAPRERLEQIAAALPAAEAAVVRARTAGELGHARDGAVRPQPQPGVGGGVRAALAAPGLDADLECRARFHRAQSVWKQRQRPRAAPLFDEADAACARAGNRDLHAKALYQGARCYAIDGQPRQRALARYARVEAEHADHSYADDARIRTAELATDAGDDATAAKLLAEVPTRYPKGDLLNEALWRLAFAAWRAGRDDEALHWLDENLRLVPHEEIWYAEGRAQYWKGRVFEKQGKPDEARDLVRARRARVPAVGLRAAVADAAARRCDRAAQKALVAELRKGLHDVPAWTFPPRALFGDAGLPARRRAGAHGPGRRRAARAAQARAGDVGREARDRRRRAPRTRICSGSRRSLLDRGGVWSASHSMPRYGADQLPARPTRRGSARRSGSSPTRAPSRRWSPRTPRPTSSPRRCSSRSCARRARSRRASNRSPTRSG